MDNKNAFAVLGVDQTEEEDRIKEAYRAKLRLVNPEDDPEGFKQLRLAYETALSHAAQNGEQADAVDDTPSGLFVQKAAALYQSIAGRQDELSWRALFREDVYLDLEEEENCREKLLAYLMSHCYLPTQIWKVLDENLQISEEKERLYEKFPKDFIDFAVRKIRQGEDFEFEQLDGPQDADLDGWIFLFAKAGGEENGKNYEAMEETVREAEKKGITHPALLLMKARMLCATGRPAEGEAIVKALLEGLYGDSLNVRYQSAEYYWQYGDKADAAPIYIRIKEENKKHYMANRRLAQWYLDRKDYRSAKECVNVLLSYPMDDEVKGLVDGINSGLKQELKRQLEENPDDLKVCMELGWCYLQDENPLKAIELMEGRVPSEDQEKDYANLMGKVYYYAKRYEQAQPVIRRWISLLNGQMPQEGQEREDDLERLATAHSMLSRMYVEKAMAETEEKRDADFESALAEIEEAKRARYNAGQDYAKASVYMEWEKYEDCVKVCVLLMNEYPDFSAAFVLHQKACAKLFDASGVIGDYFTLRRILPDYKPSWELAAEVYYQLKRTEDLDRLLTEAEENKMLTLRLKRYRFLRMTETAEKRKELLAALEYAKGISDTWEEEEWSDEEKAALFSERARNYWRLEDYENALFLIDKAIDLSEGKTAYLYVKAGIKKDQENLEEALKLYRSCKEDYDETPHYYLNVGECFYKLGNYEEALPNLKRAVELKRDNPVCCAWIIRILKAEMEKTDSLDQMEEALAYADLMLEYRAESFFHIERGLLYVLSQEYEKAAQNFENAVSADEEDPFAHSNLARMYRLLDRLPEALEQGLLAVKHMDHDPAPYHHEMLGNIYWQMRRYEDALAAFLVNWERFPKRRENFIGDFVSLYLDMGKWREALDLLKELYRETDREYVKKTVEIYCGAGFFKEAFQYAKHHCKMAGFSRMQFKEMLADICWYQGNLKKASRYIRQALKECTADHAHYPALCKRAADISFYLGRRDAAAVWAGRALLYYQNHGGFEKWLNPLEGRLNRMYLFGTLQLYRGNLKTAGEIAAEMKQCPRCTCCRHCYCTDAGELEAGILAAKGSLAEAADIYEAILKESGLDKDVRMKLALMKKKPAMR